MAQAAFSVRMDETLKRQDVHKTIMKELRVEDNPTPQD